MKSLIFMLLLASALKASSKTEDDFWPALAISSGLDAADDSLLDPCHLQNNYTLSANHGKCDIVNSRVFSNRRQLRKFRRRKRKRFNHHRRMKRDRSLLALSGPKYWPKWCNKVAFFRVFKQDFTLCLYTKRFKDDPIVAHSNPSIGTTIYGYKDKKHYQELARSSNLKYVSGYVLGHSFSGVQGYVWNHRFYGTIFVRKNVLFVEPIVSNNQIRFPYYVTSSRKVVKQKGSLNAYVYKIYSRSLRKMLKATGADLFASSRRSTNTFYLRSRVSQSSYYGRSTITTCKTCSLILVADYEFYRDVGQGSPSKAHILHRSISKLFLCAQPILFNINT